MKSVEVAFPKGRRLRVLEHRAAMHDWTNMERARMEVVLDLLKPGMTVYDVGAEQGEWGALAASVVGGGLVHLFEPSPTSWPSLRGTFGANDLGPGGCFPGFVCDHERGDWRSRVTKGWPVEGERALQEQSHFSVEFERPDICATTLDLYAAHTGTRPDLVMIDVEGAEVLVAEGMRGLLAEARPWVLVSVHPPGFLDRFPAPRRIFEQRPKGAWGIQLNCTQEHLFRIFSEAGYGARFVSEDHEVHYFFEPLGCLLEPFP